MTEIFRKKLLIIFFIAILCCLLIASTGYNASNHITGPKYYMIYPHDGGVISFNWDDLYTRWQLLVDHASISHEGLKPDNYTRTRSPNYYWEYTGTGEKDTLSLEQEDTLYMSLWAMGIRSTNNIVAYPVFKAFNPNSTWTVKETIDIDLLSYGLPSYEHLKTGYLYHKYHGDTVGAHGLVHAGRPDIVPGCTLYDMKKGSALDLATCDTLAKLDPYNEVITYYRPCGYPGYKYKSAKFLRGATIKRGYTPIDADMDRSYLGNYTYGDFSGHNVDVRKISPQEFEDLWYNELMEKNDNITDFKQIFIRKILHFITEVRHGAWPQIRIRDFLSQTRDDPNTLKTWLIHPVCLVFYTWDNNTDMRYLPEYQTAFIRAVERARADGQVFLDTCSAYRSQNPHTIVSKGYNLSITADKGNYSALIRWDHQVEIYTNMTNSPTFATWAKIGHKEWTEFQPYVREEETLDITVINKTMIYHTIPFAKTYLTYYNNCEKEYYELYTNTLGNITVGINSTKFDSVKDFGDIRYSSYNYTYYDYKAAEIAYTIKANKISFIAQPGHLYKFEHKSDWKRMGGK